MGGGVSAGVDGDRLSDLAARTGWAIWLRLGQANTTIDEMQRRAFLGGASAALAASACEPWEPPVYTGQTRTFGPHHLQRREPRSDAPNVLFLSLDDQNDWLGYLNPHPGTVSPNVDRLAARSIDFRRAYCGAPKCLPSRTAVSLGRLPHSTGIYNKGGDETQHARDTVAETPLTPDEFWTAGYDTFAAGKVFPLAKNRWDSRLDVTYFSGGRNRDDPAGRFDPNWVSPYDGLPIGNGSTFPSWGIDFGPSGVTPYTQPDGEALTYCQNVLADTHSNPFFLAMGVVAPHTPWRVPQEFFDLHPLESIEYPDFLPTDLDDLSTYVQNAFIDPGGVYAGISGAGQWEEAIQGYMAASSYTDWVVGEILAALDASPFADNTIVVLWSDHGWHLGEKLHFRKFTLWERACRVPLLIRLPGQTGGVSIPDPVSIVSMQATMAALCGFSLVGPDEGINLLDAGARAANPPVMSWLEGNHAVRQDNWRYIRYTTGDQELYDHTSDPEEWVNLAYDPSYATEVAALDALLPAP